MNDRLCVECGKHVLKGTAIATNFGVFHEGCYDHETSMHKHAKGLEMIEIRLERPIIRPRQKMTP